MNLSARKTKRSLDVRGSGPHSIKLAEQGDGGFHGITAVNGVEVPWMDLMSLNIIDISSLFQMCLKLAEVSAKISFGRGIKGMGFVSLLMGYKSLEVMNDGAILEINGTKINNPRISIQIRWSWSRRNWIGHINVEVCVEDIDIPLG